jgi:hypothetical protein
MNKNLHRKHLLMGIIWLFFLTLGSFHLHQIHYTEVDTLLNQQSSLKNNQLPQFIVQHHLSETCGCSHILTDYFIRTFNERKNLESQGHKEVFKIYHHTNHSKLALKLKKMGYQVEIHDLNSLPSEGLPLMVVKNSHHTITYSGGYTQGKIHPFSKFSDLSILNKIITNQRLEGYTPLGCHYKNKFLAALNSIGVLL